MFPDSKYVRAHSAFARSLVVEIFRLKIGISSSFNVNITFFYCQVYLIAEFPDTKQCEGVSLRIESNQKVMRQQEYLTSIFD